MQILARSRLSSKEQLSLPASIRRLLGVHAGDELVWMKDERGRLVVEPARGLTLEDIRASVDAVGPRKKPRPVSVREMKEAVSSHLRRKHGRR